MLLLLLGSYLLFAAMVIALRYLVLPAIDDYRPFIERQVSHAVGAEVRIGDIDANWMGLHPRLVLSRVDMLDAEGRVALSLPRVAALFSWRSVLVLEPRLRQLQLEAPEVEVRRDTSGRLWAAGLSFDPRAEDDSDAARWLLAQGEISVRGAVVRWVDELRQAPPLELRDLTLTIQNAGRRHRAALRALPPPELASGIDLRTDFTHRLLDFKGDDARWWQGTLYGDFDYVNLAGWRPWVELPVHLGHGAGALRAWLDFREGGFRRALADVEMHDVELSLAPDLVPLAVEEMSGRVRAERGARGHTLTVEQMRVVTHDGLTMAPTMLGESWTEADRDGPARGSFEVRGLDLSALTRLAPGLPLPAPARKALVDAAPTGSLDSLEVDWEGSLQAPGNPRVEASFSNLALVAAPALTGAQADHPQRPGFTGLSGTVQLQGEVLQVKAQGKDVVARFPGVFASPDVPLRSVDADLTVQRGPGDVWTVAMNQIRFEHERTSGQVQGVWSSQGSTEDGSLELTGRLTRADVRDVHRFMPLALDEEVRTWLRLALLSGTGSDVSVRVKGDLAEFPFGNGRPGHFQVQGKVQNVTLDYASAAMGGDVWPRLEGVSGDFSINEATLAVTTRGGRVRMTPESTLALGPAKVRIGNLEKDAVLEVDSEARGPAVEFLRAAQRPPIAAIIEDGLTTASASGEFVMPLSLRVPLLHPDDTRVAGEIRLSGNTFRHDPHSPVLSRLSGVVAFDNRGVTFRNVQGMLLDGPVTLSGGPQADGSSLVQVDGTLPASGLASLWPVPGMARASGQAVYRARLFVEPGKAPRAHLESDLVGMRLDLPAPLGKAADDILPLSLVYGPLGDGATDQGDWITASLGSALRLRLERDSRASDAGVARGALGVNQPATVSGPGFAVAVELPVIDIDAGKALVAEFQPAARTDAGAADAPPPRAQSVPRLSRVALKTGRLNVEGRQLDNVQVDAVRDMTRNLQSDTGNWHADIEAAQLAGRLSWVEGPGGTANRLTARLSRLVVQEEPGATGITESDPEPKSSNVPEFDVVAEKFELYGKSLGRLEVLANTADRGREWRLQNLSVKNADAQLVGSGVWRLEPDDGGSRKRRMSLDATLNLVDSGRFLDRLGMPATIAGGAGKMVAKVSWTGLPYSVNVPSLTGTVELDIGKGQFLKADPGIAKLLGVLSLQSLPRRVSLDFRDVFSEGFAYDTIRGHAAITNGVAHTDDFNMNGIAANVLLAGDVDLVRESQKLKVLVLPKLDAGGASLLYGLAINPAVGLSVFLAQLVLREPLAQALSYQYGVTGSWADPQIARLPLETGHPGAAWPPPRRSESQ